MIVIVVRVSVTCAGLESRTDKQFLGGYRRIALLERSVMKHSSFLTGTSGFINLISAQVHYYLLYINIVLFMLHCCV
jgi:hypothetical protein